MSQKIAKKISQTIFNLAVTSVENLPKSIKNPVNLFLLILAGWLTPNFLAFSQTTANPPLRLIINSNQDIIQPDGELTLREAISIVNGELDLTSLSAAERNQISPLPPSKENRAKIEFNLPPNYTNIELNTPLPGLAAPVVIDGTTQPGYAQEQRNIPAIPVPTPENIPPAPIRGLSLLKQGETNFCTPKIRSIPSPIIPAPIPAPIRGLGLLKELISQDSTVSNFPIPQPVIVIKPAPGIEVFRGFTVVSDDVRIRGLSIYGFSSRRRGATANIPPADIFIGDAEDTATFGEKGRARNPSKTPPQNIVIDCNWLGVDTLGKPVSQLPNSQLTQEKQVPTGHEKPGHFQIYRTDDRLPTRSAFGIYVFNSSGTTIRSNLIANHDGSGIITSARASNTLIIENILFANGFGGMPDAIRLEGEINQTRILSNLIRDNAGSGIYFFKPQGSVEIRQNKITNNGRQFNQAAIYLMGNDHQIINNEISEQSGPGIVVAAYPNSDRNIILGNSFANLQGLSIDLVTQMNTGFHAYLTGDGPNPKMRSFQRRRQTANFGIDAPNFISKEFFLNPENGSVTLEGTAKPGSTIEIYRVNENSSSRGPLSEAIANTVTDEEGKFSLTLTNLKAGERISAIANDSESGTSEPAVNTVIKDLP
ncbi:right-handed parallel beta-helix repeat-containing protein [Aerosakkonemataceae cyanobacterium BLCC-F154]|uniref:Right-handed parallel beta-helix repeat-containing protein n=1 Tax=Floridaenema fluviatile BLCC-F154 TaxID=3153640 RepID=A0ABV4Y9F2_9CYAN